MLRTMDTFIEHLGTTEISEDLGQQMHLLHVRLGKMRDRAKQEWSNEQRSDEQELAEEASYHKLRAELAELRDHLEISSAFLGRIV